METCDSHAKVKRVVKGVRLGWDFSEVGLGGMGLCVKGGGGGWDLGGPWLFVGIWVQGGLSGWEGVTDRSRAIFT